MVEALINDKALAERKVAAYWERLKPFYTGDSAFAPVCMACLAAFPVVLTADLAYQLWANFRELQDLKGNKHRLPPLVVSDCILSPLWRNTGNEVFELDPDTRAYLLDGLRKKFGDAIIGELASFLYNYIDEKKDSRMPASFAEAQQWTALLAVDAPEAARHILNALDNKLSEGRFGEGMGISNLLATLSRDSNELAEIMRSSMSEPVISDNTARTMSRDKRLRIQEGTGNNAFSIDIPDELAGPLMPILERGAREAFINDTVTNANRKLHAVVVALNEHRFLKKRLIKSVNDASNFIKLIESGNISAGAETNITQLFDKEATRSNVMNSLQSALSNAGPDDTVLFYFCGSIAIENELHYFLLYDTRETPTSITDAISNSEFRGMIESGSRGDTRVLVVLDACNSGTPDWLPASNSRHIGLMSSQARQLSFERPSMTDVLVEAPPIGRSTTYRDLYMRLLSRQENQVAYFKIDRNSWDSYVVTGQQKPNLLIAKELLIQLGYPLYADNNPSDPAFSKAILEFAPASNASNQTFSAEELVRRSLPALRRANLMRKANDLGIVYLHVAEPGLDLDIAQSDITESHREQVLENALEKIEGAKVDFFSISGFSDENWNSLRKKILSNQWLLIGINNHWINNKQHTAAIESLLDLAFASDRLVDFVLEEECDWRRPPMTAYSVLPDSLRPITDPAHLNRMLEQMHSIIPGLTKYIGFKTPKQVDQRLEKRLRDARRTGQLDLSNLELFEFPSIVFQETGILSLDCSNNQLRNIPSGITQWQQLRKLDISQNPIDHLPKAICYLPQLTELNLAKTNISDLPQEMHMLRLLDKLDLRETPMTIFNAGAFADRFPTNIILPQAGSFNLPENIQKGEELATYLLRAQDKSYVFIEIHSESALPRYQKYLQHLTDDFAYYFFENVATPDQLFKHLYGLAGTKRTIVYLCDSKNILGPQFAEQASFAYSFFRALGEKIGLIANNASVYVASAADLTGEGQMDFFLFSEETSSSAIPMADEFIQRLAAGESVNTAIQTANYQSTINGNAPQFRIGNNFEDYSLPLARVRRTSNTIKKSAQKPVAERLAKFPFSGKRILVTGTWHQKLMSTGEYSVVHAIGKLLAEEGHGLITGGYPGIDEEVALYFAEALGTLGIGSRDRLTQVLSTSDKPSFKGDSRILRVKQKEWTDRVLSMSAAVIVIGGSRLVEQTVNDAMTRGIPVLPIAESGKVARQVYDRLYNESGFNFLPTQLNALAAGLTNKGLVELIAGIRSILQNIPASQTVPVKAKAPVKKTSGASHTKRSTRKMPRKS